MVRVEAFKFGIQIDGKNALRRGELEGVRERVVPFSDEFLQSAPVAVGTDDGLEAVFQIVAQTAQQDFIGLGMQPDCFRT